MLIVLLIACVPVLLGLITQRLRPEVSLLAASMALGWYVTERFYLIILRNWETTYPYVRSTIDLDLYPEMMREGVFSAWLTAKTAFPAIATAAAIIAFLSVVSALSFPRLMQRVVWFVQISALTSLVASFAALARIEAEVDAGIHYTQRTQHPVVDFLHYDLFGNYAPIVFLIACAACVLLRLHQQVKAHHPAT